MIDYEKEYHILCNEIKHAKKMVGCFKNATVKNWVLFDRMVDDLLIVLTNIRMKDDD